MSIVYLNGEFIPKDQAFISVDDRGFLFGDGIYEVTAIYRGKMFRWERHLARMQRGLAALRIEFDPDVHPSDTGSIVDQQGHGDRFVGARHQVIREAQRNRPLEQGEPYEISGLDADKDFGC